MESYRDHFKSRREERSDTKLRARYLDDLEDDRAEKRSRREAMAALSDWSIVVHVADDVEAPARSFAVNRGALALASGFFRTCFETRLNEGRSETVLTLSADCCDAFESMLAFIYDGELELPDGVETWVPCLALAREFDVPSLRDVMLERVGQFFDLLYSDDKVPRGENKTQVGVSELATREWRGVKRGSGSRRVYHEGDSDDDSINSALGDDLSTLYAHANEYGFGQLQSACEKQIVALRLPVESLDELPISSIVKLVDTASTDTKFYGETMCAWVIKLVWRRLHDVGDVKPEEVRSLLDSLAPCLCFGYDDRNVYNDDPAKLGLTAEQARGFLRLSMEHHGGLKVSGPVRYLARDDFDDVSGEFQTQDWNQIIMDMARKDFENHYMSAKSGLYFPVGLTQERLGARFDTSAAIYLTAVLEYLAAEVLELSGKAAEERDVETILARDVNSALNGDVELRQTAYQSCRSLDLVLQSLCLATLGRLLLEQEDDSLVPDLPLDALLVLWQSVLCVPFISDRSSPRRRRSAYTDGVNGYKEDIIFDSIEGYLDATSPGPEVHARAWQTCSFAHISDEYFDKCSTELLPRIFTPAQLYALREARDILELGAGYLETSDSDNDDAKSLCPSDKEEKALAILEKADVTYIRRNWYRHYWFSSTSFYFHHPPPTMPATREARDQRRSSTATVDA